MVKTFLILKVVFCIREKNELFFTSLVIKTKIIALLHVLYKMLVVNHNGKCSFLHRIIQKHTVLQY